MHQEIDKWRVNWSNADQLLVNISRSITAIQRRQPEEAFDQRINGFHILLLGNGKENEREL